jgi:hypothetical protein
LKKTEGGAHNFEVITLTLNATKKYTWRLNLMMVHKFDNILDLESAFYRYKNYIVEISYATGYQLVKSLLICEIEI